MLNYGCLVEYDTPQALLSRRNSHFSSLIYQAGFAEAEYLRTLVARPIAEMHVSDEEQVIEMPKAPLSVNDSEAEPLLPSTIL